MGLKLIQIGDNEYRPDGIWKLTAYDYTEVEVNGKIRGFWDSTCYSYEISKYFKKDFPLDKHKCTILNNEKHHKEMMLFYWDCRMYFYWKSISIKIFDKEITFWYLDDAMLMACLKNYSEDITANLYLNLKDLGIVDETMDISSRSRKTDIYQDKKIKSIFVFTLYSYGWGNYVVMEIDFYNFLNSNYNSLEDWQIAIIKQNYPVISKIFGVQLTDIEKNQIALEFFNYLITNKK